MGEPALQLDPEPVPEPPPPAPGEVAADQTADWLSQAPANDVAPLAEEEVLTEEAVEFAIVAPEVAVAVVAVAAVLVVGYLVYKAVQSSDPGPDAAPSPVPSPNPAPIQSCPASQPNADPPASSGQDSPGSSSSDPSSAVRGKPFVPNPYEVARDPERAEQRRKQVQQKRDQDCQDLYDQMDRMTNRQRTEQGSDTQGLKNRYMDQICSEYDPATPVGAELWDSHDKTILEQRSGLNQKLTEFEDNCEGDPPPNTEDFARRNKPPTKAEWKGNSAECIEYRAERGRIRDPNNNLP